MAGTTNNKHQKGGAVKSPALHNNHKTMNKKVEAVMNTTKNSTPVEHSIHKKNFYNEAIAMFAWVVTDGLLMSEDFKYMLYLAYNGGNTMEEFAERIFDTVDPEAEDDHSEEHKRGEWGNWWECDDDYRYSSDDEPRPLWRSIFQEGALKMCRHRGITEAIAEDHVIDNLSSKAVTSRGTFEGVYRAVSEELGLTYQEPISPYSFALEVIEKCQPLIDSGKTNRGEILDEIDAFMDEDAILDFINSCTKCYKTFDPCDCNSYMEQIIENVRIAASK